MIQRALDILFNKMKVAILWNIEKSTKRFLKTAPSEIFVPVIFSSDN